MSRLIDLRRTHLDRDSLTAILDAQEHREPNRRTHTCDEDCAPYIDFDDIGTVCTVCHVMHGEPCQECGGRGYHRPMCSDSEPADELQLLEVDSAATAESIARRAAVHHGTRPDQIVAFLQDEEARVRS